MYIWQFEKLYQFISVNVYIIVLNVHFNIDIKDQITVKNMKHVLMGIIVIFYPIHSFWSWSLCPISVQLDS